ncbi:hypothetical protein CLV98_104349 [Dyadobacter jejuensis]|uniref:Collagen triple helix repeat protein n=1 Tax=Dyadobacter jejuensis TaxID=1082580 RepID=A0A316AMH3_9BACT|nr:hypothetical protein [Dyadobacter jejuensis]PWJ58489.1 hypothetical protein CLV98_104349 [Dyadobacter jejuensis]
MNKKLIPLLVIIAAIFQACSGTQGPIGPQGPQGEPGDAYLGQAFDLTGVNFNANENYTYGIRYADAQINVLESDALLIYIRWDDVEVDGQMLPTWRLLPQTEFVDNGTLVYNFDRTKVDFSIFLSANFNLNTLSSVWTQNQTFRVVAIPADFALRTSEALDYSDYEAVKERLQLDESKIPTVTAL